LEKKSAYRQTLRVYPFRGEMETLLAFFVPLPQMAAANKVKVVFGRIATQEAFWCGRIKTMTIRAGLDCHA
jgi:hypothetical protein